MQETESRSIGLNEGVSFGKAGQDSDYKTFLNGIIYGNYKTPPASSLLSDSKSYFERTFQITLKSDSIYKILNTNNNITIFEWSGLYYQDETGETFATATTSVANVNKTPKRVIIYELRN